jgi:hypothetical protein
MTPAGNWSRLPEELRARPQWAVAGASKAPMGVDSDGKLRLISVTAPTDWLSFDQACALAYSNRELTTTHTSAAGVTTTQVGLTIGYILNEDDPFSCIDLDVKDALTHPNEPDKWTSPDDFSRFMSIVSTMDSYAERSKSGKGLHIWVKGKIGKGFRRDGVEVYSQERFIICTGDVYVPKGVENRELILQNMVARMRPIVTEIVLEEIPQAHDDWYILQTAIYASNGDKFWTLWQGKWKEYENFPSQSEADLALMSMFTFYSESNAQCKRLFRMSMLGKREKATKNDTYLNHTLRIIRTRQANEARVELSGILSAAEQMQALSREGIQDMQGGVPAAPQVQDPFGGSIAPRVQIPLQVPGAGEPVATPAPAATALPQLAPVSALAAQAGQQGLPWPPGFVGAIAQFLYSNSILPIKEVSICAALGLVAGICGKAWHIPKSGLNLYIVLVARSATGKEALHDGISTLVSACVPKFPQFGNYVDFTEYASGPALIKACAQNTSFVNVSGEWGRRMKRIAMEDGRDGPMATLRTQMTNLYQKSAPKSIVGGIGYSAQENNIEQLTAVAYSMVGESTPQTFYDSLTETMMEDGFLSRFLVIAYDGERPEENQQLVTVPDEALVNGLCTLAYQAEMSITQATSMMVNRTERAAVMLKDFNDHASEKIRSTNEESRRQMWNRANLKVLRVSALLAVADNPTNPIVDIQHVEWAKDLILRDIDIMRKRLEQGDVGLGDSSRERKLVAIIKSYLIKPVPEGYKVPDEMRQNGIVPRSYLLARVNRASAFYNHKFGASKALDEALHGLVQNGHLMTVKQDKLVDMYNCHGVAFRILQLPDYESMSKDKE